MKKVMIKRASLIGRIRYGCGCDCKITTGEGAGF